MSEPSERSLERPKEHICLPLGAIYEDNKIWKIGTLIFVLLIYLIFYSLQVYNAFTYYRSK